MSILRKLLFLIARRTNRYQIVATLLLLWTFTSIYTSQFDYTTYVIFDIASTKSVGSQLLALATTLRQADLHHMMSAILNDSPLLDAFTNVNMTSMKVLQRSDISAFTIVKQYNDITRSSNTTIQSDRDTSWLRSAQLVQQLRLNYLRSFNDAITRRCAATVVQLKSRAQFCDLICANIDNTTMVNEEYIIKFQTFIEYYTKMYDRCHRIVIFTNENNTKSLANVLQTSLYAPNTIFANIEYSTFESLCVLAQCDGTILIQNRTRHFEPIFATFEFWGAFLSQNMVVYDTVQSIPLNNWHPYASILHTLNVLSD
jgi:hypothetical protein